MTNALPLPPDALLARHLDALLGVEAASAAPALRERLHWVEVTGGQTLMRQGEPGDAMYLVLSGRLRAVAADDGAPPRPVGDLVRGDVVGELSLIGGLPRSATVTALRDAVLARLDRDDWFALLADHPQLALALGRRAVARLQPRRAGADRPVTMALLPISDGVDDEAFAQRLAAALRTAGRVAVVGPGRIDADLGQRGAARSDGDPLLQRRIALRLDEIEAAHDFVLLLGDPAPTPWTRRCCRHADEVLLLADADQPPQLHATEQECLLSSLAPGGRREVLVLLHPAARRSPRGTRAWLDRRPVADHVHVRPALQRDMSRLARLQSRTAVGLVLAGGGARGFAHLGVYRALRERGIEVDVVGGTSIGAVMATYVASDRPLDAIEANVRRAFARSPTGDVSWLPLISLFRGRRLRATLASAIDDLLGFDADVEDLWKNHYSVATNVSQAREQVLRRGNLVRALLASIAIPGALPPVVADGDLLCDGGTFNNFPVDVMQGMRGVGRVIGVDLERRDDCRLDGDELPGVWALLRDRLRPRARQRHARVPTLAAYLRRVTILYSTSRQRRAQTLADLCFRPPLDRVGLLDWHRFERIAEQGYHHACAVLDALPQVTPPAPAAPPVIRAVADSEPELHLSGADLG